MISAILTAVNRAVVQHRLDVPPTVYVPNVSDMRQSKPLILQAPRGRKEICNNFLKRNCLRK
jgi:hypothetical protein